MSKIHIVRWKWNANYRTTFKSEYVNVHDSMVRRHYDGDVRLLCVTDDPEGVECETFPLWDDCKDMINASGTRFPSCYRRLKLFDPATQDAMGIEPGDRIVSIDLDTVLLGDLNALWDRNEAFVGWKVQRSNGMQSFQGTMWMFRAGEFSEVWTDFDPAHTPREANRRGYLGSDQAVMSMMVGEQAGWGKEDGVYARMDVILNKSIPRNAKLISFHGGFNPWDEPSSAVPDWIVEHWR